jgi:hypothetical protein
MGKPDFKFFDWDMNPIGKYKQPEPNNAPTGENGYPEKDINVGVTHMDMQGAGAATKGKKFIAEVNLKKGGLAGVLTRQGKERG